MFKRSYSIEITFVVSLIVSTILFLLIPDSLFAQKLSFRNYSVQEGMPQSQINDIVQDKMGYLWFATAEGLTSFDGKQFIQHSKRDGLAGSFIYDICIDHKGDFWLGHRAMGISRYNFEQKKFEKIDSPPGYENTHITDIIEEKPGVLWFATAASGLLKYENNAWTVYDKSSGLPTLELFSLCFNQNDLWIGSSQGIIILSSQLESGPKFSMLPVNTGVSNGKINVLLKDKHGVIWIGDSKAGILNFTPSPDPGNLGTAGTFSKISDQLGVHPISVESIFEDSDNNIWFGTAEKGIIRYSRPQSTDKPEEFFIINREKGFKERSVKSIFQDREGSIWIGTDGDGVFQYRGEAFELYGKNEGILDEIVWAIHEDQKGGLWFGTEKGLTYFPDQMTSKPRYFTSKNWNGNNMVMDIHEDSRGYIWLCVHGSGVREFNPETKQFRSIAALEKKNIINIEEDSHGNLWFGGFSNGVFKLDQQTGEIQNFKAEDGLGSNTVFKIFRAKNGDLWFATNGAGISKFDGTSFTNYAAEQGLHAPSVLSLADDDYGNLWIGSEGDGLFRYDGSSFEDCSQRYGLWKDDIYSLVCDDQNNVWIGTRRGVEKFNSKTKKNKKYGEFEGFSAIETNQNAAYKDKNGQLWFGTIQGVVKYNPDHDIHNTVPPVIYINKIRVYLQDFPLPEDRIFSYKDNFLTFNFHGLCFIVPEKIKYSYILEGLDRDWSPLTDETYATYANLSPGDYIFKVKAKNNDDVWSDQAAKYSFSIAAPFWLKGWFYLLIAFAIGLIIYGVHAYRVRNFHRNNIRLEEMVHARTKDLYAEKEKTQKAYEALLESESKLKQVTQSVNAFLWSTAIDENGHMDYIFITDTFLQISGYSHDDFPKGDNKFKQFLQIVHPEDREYLINSLQRILAGQKMHLSYRIIRKDGQIRWLYDNPIPVNNKDGRVNLIHGVGIDATDRKLAEEALKKSEEIYHRLIERSPDAIVVHSEGKIDYVNQAGIKLFGATNKNQLIGKKLIDLSHPDYRELGMKRVKQIYEEKKDVDLLEQQMIRLDGTEFDVEVMGAPVIFRGKASGQSIIRDITNRKKMEEEIQKGQKLESVGILAGGIAHDFNNILTAILGNISLGKLYTQEKENAQRVLGEAEKATLHAKDLTQQLLTFSKGGAPVKETTSIVDVVKDSANFVLSGSKIECNYEYSQDLWAVDVDSSQISQVIQNLIINAEQAMPNGKKINIILENITSEKHLPPGLKPGKYVKIILTDDGIGIPEEHLNKIFDPYFTTKQKGSGLGLATTYSIIKRHDGHIDIKSKIGKGTCVELYIPASEKDISKKHYKSTIIEQGNGRILVMDDEEMLRELSKQFLTHLGYDVETAPDGESAIEMFQSAKDKNFPFSLVIMDLTIPGGMGGKETMAKLKEIDPKVKAIVSSGYSNDPVLSNFKKHGFIAVLTKPYKIETLSSIISHVMNGKKEKLVAS